jgi:hypothetical protein
MQCNFTNTARSSCAGSDLQDLQHQWLRQDLACPRVNVVSVALQLPVLTYRNAPVVFSAQTFTEVGAALAEINPPMTDPRPTARPRTNTFPLNRLNRSINALLVG